MQLSGVRLFVCPSDCPTEAAAEEQLWHSPFSRNRAAGSRGHSTALSSKCGQCHVYSQGTRLNTELFSAACLYSSPRCWQVLKICMNFNPIGDKLSVSALVGLELHLRELQLGACAVRPIVVDVAWSVCLSVCPSLCWLGACAMRPIVVDVAWSVCLSVLLCAGSAHAQCGLLLST